VKPVKDSSIFRILNLYLKDCLGFSRSVCGISVVIFILLQMGPLGILPRRMVRGSLGIGLCLERALLLGLEHGGAKGGSTGHPLGRKSDALVMPGLCCAE